MNNVPASGFSEVDLTPNGDNGISLLVPEDGTKYSLKFDEHKESPGFGGSFRLRDKSVHN